MVKIKGRKKLGILARRIGKNHHFDRGSTWNIVVYGCSAATDSDFPPMKAFRNTVMCRDVCFPVQSYLPKLASSGVDADRT